MTEIDCVSGHDLKAFVLGCRRYPGRSEEADVAASLVYSTLFRLRDGNPEDEATARRLFEYRPCYGVPLTLPKPAKSGAIPPCWRAADLVPGGGS
jgi:hypothetical protein